MKEQARILVQLVAAACCGSCARPGAGEASQSPAAVSTTETPPAPVEADDDEGGLEISISTDRETYSAGDEVVLVVTIENTGSESVTLVHPDYWSVSEIRVTDAGGADVEPSSFKGERKALADLMTIPSGESRSHTFEKLTSWTCCFGYSFHGMLEPGTYQIVVSVTNPPVEVDPPQGWTAGWSGTLVSEPVTIEVQ
jgi:hypothetical protein